MGHLVDEQALQLDVLGAVIVAPQVALRPGHGDGRRAPSAVLRGWNGHHLRRWMRTGAGSIASPKTEATILRSPAVSGRLSGRHALRRPSTTRASSVARLAMLEAQRRAAARPPAASAGSTSNSIRCRPPRREARSGRLPARSAASGRIDAHRSLRCIVSCISIRPRLRRGDADQRAMIGRHFDREIGRARAARAGPGAGRRRRLSRARCWSLPRCRAIGRGLPQAASGRAAAMIGTSRFMPGALAAAASCRNKIASYIASITARASLRCRGRAGRAAFELGQRGRTWQE